MDAETMWNLFWTTGLPEAAALAAFLQQEQDNPAQEDKTA